MIGRQYSGGRSTYSLGLNHTYSYTIDPEATERQGLGGIASTTEAAFRLLCGGPMHHDDSLYGLTAQRAEFHKDAGLSCV